MCKVQDATTQTKRARHAPTTTRTTMLESQATLGGCLRMLELLLLQLGTYAWAKPRGPGVMRGIADRGDPQDNHATPFEKVMDVKTGPGECPCSPTSSQHTALAKAAQPCSVQQLTEGGRPVVIARMAQTGEQNERQTNYLRDTKLTRATTPTTFLLGAGIYRPSAWTSIGGCHSGSTLGQ